MLSPNDAPSGRANPQTAPPYIERLAHLVQTVCAGLAVPGCTARKPVRLGATPRGFDWHAPIYEAPIILKDTLCMQKPSRDTGASSDGETTGTFRWRRHPALLKSRTTPMPLDEEQQARLAAVRGVLAARAGDLETASAWFTEAAQDLGIRFQVVPGFWGCTRGGMEAAVAAYEAAGRFRDAAALAATIRTRYRPRMVSAGNHEVDRDTRPARSAHRESASGAGD
ncbi:MAG: hypothetical protein QM589_05200 [Thermomicrobiales bacterium]